MKEHIVLKLILEASDGTTPAEIAKKLAVALPNIYAYLKKLSHENLIYRNAHGKYYVNKTNKKVEQILDLQAMCPTKFDTLISLNFRTILEKLCKKLKVKREDLNYSDIGKIRRIAIPLRLVLRIPKRPVIYSLKLNEALVKVLLDYHNIKPTFNELEFQKMINELNLRRPQEKIEIVKSDSEVKEMCDNLYESKEDDFVSKVINFMLDERLNGLLRTADQTNKEYILFLNALDKNTKAALEDRWEKRYIYNTNSIEGNTMSENDVNVYLIEKKEPQNISRREIYETNNLNEVLQFLKLKRNEDISEELAREVHFLIQKNIEEKAGNYKTFYNYIQPNSPTTPPQHIKSRMAMLIDWYKSNKDKTHPLVLASIFHMQFEIIHPFGDGNGRVGRLLLNHILTQENYMPLTIMEKTKQNYYNALANRSLSQFLLYTLSSFIEEYKR